MDTSPKRPTSVFYILMTLGMLCLALLGIWLSCLITLREEMSISQSPMVGGAPFLNILFIFLFAWVSYAFFGAAAADKRTSEGRRPIPWGTSAFWFAVAIVHSPRFTICCNRNRSRNTWVISGLSQIKSGQKTHKWLPHLNRTEYIDMMNVTSTH